MESNAGKWLPHRDVPTSRRWVNQYRNQQSEMSRRLNVATSQRRDVSTSRRLNVATSQRPDVSTSRRLNVPTSQRRDVSTGSSPHHLKHQWFRIQGMGRRTNEGTEFQSSSDTDFEEVPVICTVSHFWILE